MVVLLMLGIDFPGLQDCVGYQTRYIVPHHGAQAVVITAVAVEIAQAVGGYHLLGIADLALFGLLFLIACTQHGDSDTCDG